MTWITMLGPEKLVLLTITYLFLICICCGSAKNICCDNGDCYDDSPPFDNDFLPLPMCPEEMKPIFLMFTRKNKDVPEEFDRFSVPLHFEGHKKTVIVLHGYNNDHTKGWIERTRLALLERADVNVVVVGWGIGASALYPKAVSNSRVIATETHYVMQNLYRAGAAPDRMWCVGHSLGTHACGGIGKISKFARITGLDPAGPFWDEMQFSAGLTKDDADFVDNIHTHGKGGLGVKYGSLLARGHLDFYPNNAGFQPGCETDDKGRARCSHSRAKEYFIESIAEPCLRATEKCTDFKKIPETCSTCAICPYMGYDADTSAPHGLYNLATNDAVPWCLQ